jgi:hypothetical protein
MSERSTPAGPVLRRGAGGGRGVRSAVVFPVALLLLLGTGAARAQDPRQIVDEAQKRTRSSSERYEGVLQVIKEKGNVADKSWTFARIGSHGNSKSVLRFTSPATVKGVALLVVNHPDRASDQWMWTPATARDRRIALQDRSAPFFGTDFSFEDLEERDVDQYDYRMLGDDTVEGVACWKIEARPKQGKSSQYTVSRVWIRKDNYAFAVIENDARGRLARRLRYLDLKNVQGIWTAMRLEMTDVRKKSRTILRLEKLQYNAPMNDADFTLQALRREL